MGCLSFFSRLASLAIAGALTLWALGCAELKTASLGDGDAGDPRVGASGGSGSSGSSGSSSSSGSSGADASGTPAGAQGSGPGIHGSLPFGYCCADDSECRDRHCVAVSGGAKMCEDACREQASCVRRTLAFTCSSSDTGSDGWCGPPTPSFACIPQAMFARGTRQVGECCAATGDGNSGEECEGNKCISIGMGGSDGPFVCSQRCDTALDCPDSTVCGPFNTCDPANFPYTCK